MKQGTAPPCLGHPPAPKDDVFCCDCPRMPCSVASFSTSPLLLHSQSHLRSSLFPPPVLHWNLSSTGSLDKVPPQPGRTVWFSHMGNRTSVPELPPAGGSWRRSGVRTGTQALHVGLGPPDGILTAGHSCFSFFVESCAFCAWYLYKGCLPLSRTLFWDRFTKDRPCVQRLPCQCCHTLFSVLQPPVV